VIVVLNLPGYSPKKVLLFTILESKSVVALICSVFKLVMLVNARANDIYLVNISLLFCKRHGKFLKSHNSGFKSPIKMIETGKHSAFRGTICNKDYTMRLVFLGTVLRANGIFLSKH